MIMRLLINCSANYKTSSNKTSHLKKKERKKTSRTFWIYR